jgi:hypothetical protein
MISSASAAHLLDREGDAMNVRFLVSLAMMGAVAACDGGLADLGGKSESASSFSDAGGDQKDGTAQGCTGTDCSNTKPDANVADSGCPSPSGVLVTSGSTITPRPTGSALRLDVLYQGYAMGIDGIKGWDAIVPADSGPLKAGFNSGYWFELQDATGVTLYTHWINDPTRLEAPGPSPDGGFTNSVRPLCDEKSIRLELPNDPDGKAIVIYGSPYGTQNVASELARFILP